MIFIKNTILLFTGLALLASCGGDTGEGKNVKEKFLKNSPVKGEQYELVLAGASIPKKLSLDDLSLRLNGAGVRNKFHLKVYAAGLYLTKKSSNALEIINENEPQAIRMHITSILMTSDNMTKYIIEGFERSTNGHTKPIKPQIELAVKIFNQEPVEKGDVFDVFYLPNENGVKAYKNGQFLSFIQGGIEFKKALFGIWLSDDPVDEDLKDGLLGLKTEF